MAKIFNQGKACWTNPEYPKSIWNFWASQFEIFAKSSSWKPFQRAHRVFATVFLQIQFPSSLARKKGSVQQNNVASTDEVCVGFEIFICDTHFALCMNPHTNVSGPSWNFPDRVSIMLRPIKTNFMNVREYFSAWIILVSFLNYLWRRQIICNIRSKTPCYEGLKSEVAWIFSNHGFLIHRFFQ